MHITTVHTLAFNIKCVGNEQQAAAHALIKGGAASLGLTVTISSMPLPSDQDNLTRNSSVVAQSNDMDKCEHYWIEVQRALAFMGVEATSP